MNKNVNILGTGKKQWGCEFLNCNFSPKNQPTKQTNQFTNLNRFIWEESFNQK